MGNDLSCSLCKTVMELVDQAITDGANEQAVGERSIQEKIFKAKKSKSNMGLATIV